MNNFLLKHSSESGCDAVLFKSNQEEFNAEEIAEEVFGFDIQEDSEVEITMIDIDSIIEIK